MSDAIDYRALLKRYMEGVRAYEGIDFVQQITGVGFLTPEEEAELKALSDVVYAEELEAKRRREIELTLRRKAKHGGA